MFLPKLRFECPRKAPRSLPPRLPIYPRIYARSRQRLNAPQSARSLPPRLPIYPRLYACSRQRSNAPAAARPFPPPRARSSRRRAPIPAAAGASPAPAARAMGANHPRPRTAPAFRAPFRRKKRDMPHSPAHQPGAIRPAPAVGRLGGARRPLQVKSESGDMRGGFGPCCARLPYAVSRLGGLKNREGNSANFEKGRHRRTFSICRKRRCTPALSAY